MLVQGDSFHIPLPDRSAHCVVTSPPYHGLRRYSGNQGSAPLGLEEAEERHLERMILIGRELRRVLRPDGVMWWNYADAFIDGNLSGMAWRIALAFKTDGWILRNDVVWSKPNPMPESVNGWRWQRERIRKGVDPRREYAHTVGQPAQRLHDGSERFAQPDYEYGDYELRRGSWRHTRAHEYVFMLVKGMQYWSNQEAVREASVDPEGSAARYEYEFSGRPGLIMPDGKKQQIAPEGMRQWRGGRNPRSVLDIPTSPYKGAHYATFPPNLIAPLIRATCPRWCCPVCGQGWAPVVEPTERYAQLLGRSIHDHKRDDERGNQHDKEQMASMDSVRGDGLRHAEYRTLGYRPNCEHYEVHIPKLLSAFPMARNARKRHHQDISGEWERRMRMLGNRKILIWILDNWPHQPGIVLDPFIGSGTTVAVANQLLRRGIGLDISRPYLTEQATLRTGYGVKPDQLEGLPLFE